MSIPLICPYCDSTFDVPCPDKLGKTDDVKCVPYTRDVGRFDPKTKDEPFSAKIWSRIGKDYLPLLNWESIGILRLVAPGINIQYRVQECNACKNLFDVYANYSAEKIKNIWPHLFGEENSNNGKLSPYFGNSLVTWLTTKLGLIFKLKLVGAIFFGITLLLFSLFPYIYFRIPLDSTTITMLNFITKSSAVIGVIVILLLIERYVAYLSNSEEVKNLLDVKSSDGYVYWRNYTLSRFIGVQKGTGFPRLTQSDYVVGLLAILLLSSTWLLSKFHLTGVIIGVGLLLSFGLITFINSILKKKVKRVRKVFWIKVLIGILFFLPLFYLGRGVFPTFNFNGKEGYIMLIL